jgi:hypothetical protein
LQSIGNFSSDGNISIVRTLNVGIKLVKWLSLWWQ